MLFETCGAFMKKGMIAAMPYSLLPVYINFPAVNQIRSAPEYKTG